MPDRILPTQAETQYKYSSHTLENSRIVDIGFIKRIYRDDDRGILFVDVEHPRRKAEGFDFTNHVELISLNNGILNLYVSIGTMVIIFCPYSPMHFGSRSVPHPEYFSHLNWKAIPLVPGGIKESYPISVTDDVITLDSGNLSMQLADILQVGNLSVGNDYIDFRADPMSIHLEKDPAMYTLSILDAAKVRSLKYYDLTTKSIFTKRNSLLDLDGEKAEINDYTQVAAWQRVTDEKLDGSIEHTLSTLDTDAKTPLVVSALTVGVDGTIGYVANNADKAEVVNLGIAASGQLDIKIGDGALATLTFAPDGSVTMAVDNLTITTETTLDITATGALSITSSDAVSIEGTEVTITGSSSGVKLTGSSGEVAIT